MKIEIINTFKNDKLISCDFSEIKDFLIFLENNYKIKNPTEYKYFSSGISYLKYNFNGKEEKYFCDFLTIISNDSECKILVQIFDNNDTFEKIKNSKMELNKTEDFSVENIDYYLKQDNFDIFEICWNKKIKDLEKMKEKIRKYDKD